MKRTIFVSALVLALMVMLSGEAFSLSAPWGSVDPGSTGDDHTWGGDFQAGSDIPSDGFKEIPDSYIPLNMIISTILYKWLDLSSFANGTDTEADIFIQNQILDTEPVEPVTSPNTGGLQ